MRPAGTPTPFDFDTPLSRAGTGSVKYELRGPRFGRDDVLPLWVADMDFAGPPCVTEALAARAAHPIYGYTLATDDVYAAIIDWQWRRHGWQVEREWITLLPGVVPGLALAVQAFTRPGEGVLVQPPVYYPFFDVIEHHGRRVVRAPLDLDGPRPVMDLDRLDAALGPDCRLLLLSSPHNPGGRVWERAELEALGERCLRHGITLIADEIHADLAHAGHRHRPFASLDPELARRSVTLNSPGKSFNMPGLAIGYAITPDAGLRARFAAAVQAQHLLGANLFAYPALVAAYRAGEPWLAALMDYLAGNIALARAELGARRPEIGCPRPEATYLLWLDCRAWLRATGMDDAALHRRLIAAGLGLSPGVQFGPEGSGHMRMNVALPRAQLLPALERLGAALG